MFLPSFLLLAIGVHLLLLYSIFDIYYSSPIVHGARSFPVGNNPPAERIVFFSADGLRASSFFDHPGRSPFLHRLINNGKAVWGISHSHVPTESRPGHVALMAGFYEDVSAVTRGWKHNPVPFDSSLNQSSRAFLWGSPDIVHLFSANIPHSWAEVYSAELEDFASKDAVELDQWVFQRVQALFDRLKYSPELSAQLATPKSIFFLHLLGLDTNGHGQKPRSEKYLENIAIVDSGVGKMVRLFEDHFRDNKTAYIFTSDHGMTDWGSHGDGTDDEVQVPFVAWGAGLSPFAGSPGSIKLAQVDIAPLQSALLGIPIPRNNFGLVPVELLQVNPRYRFQVAYANFKQMAELMSIRRSERRAHSLPLMFTECPTLRWDALAKLETEILRLAQLKRWEPAWKACLQLVPVVREAVHYFHRYHRFSQGLAIGALFCAWNFVLFASMTAGRYRPNLSLYQIYVPAHPFALVLILSGLLVWSQHLPAINLLYFLMPSFLFSVGINLLDCNKSQFGTNCWLLLKKIVDKKALFTFGFSVLSFVLLISVFFHRFILSVAFLALSPLSWLFWRKERKKVINWPLAWSVTCLLLALFPLLPTVGNWPQPLLVLSAQSLCSLTLFLYARWQPHQFLLCPWSLWLNLLATGLLAFEFLLGSPWLVRPFAWLILPLSFLLPLWLCRRSPPPPSLSIRLLLWSTFLQLPFSLLSVGHESLFLPLFSALLFLHFVHTTEKIGGSKLKTEEKENGLLPKANRANSGGIEETNGVMFSSLQHQGHTTFFTMDEWLQALFLVAAIEMAFFGTGNIASLNSFNPSFLRLFLSVFSPFTMAALLLLKVFIPLLIVALYFAACATKYGQTNEGISRLSTLVALITNTMAMAFYYCLRTDGSWLQIGISISNYVICLVCSGATYLLLHLSSFLLHIN